jgi:phosphonate transport system substrate-binding protein
MRFVMLCRAAFAALMLVGSLPALAQSQTPTQALIYSIGVLNQRSPQLTARYWNPILDYVSRKSGVTLTLRMGKTAPETTAMTVNGEYDFAYTNHLFTPEREKLGWRVIARPVGEPIMGQLVVLEGSRVQNMAELAGQDVAFPSEEAYVGYQVPMDGLLRAGVQVRPVFAGNQEGAMGQLRVGAVSAAGVNAKVMADYAAREGIKYRVIWQSVPYLDLAVMVHPRVPREHVEAVRAALVGMKDDPEGQRVLAESAAVINQLTPPGFVAAENADYDNYRRFFRTSLVK